MRLDGIDLLRGLAVSTVIVYHFFAILGLQGSPYFHYIHSFGIFGVSLFFIISGFLIYRSISFSLERYGTKAGLKHYALHRLFRILPAYYFNFAVVLLMATFIIGNDYLYSASFLKQIFAHLTFLSYFIYQDSGLGVNGAYWTLSIEMLWYFIAPLILLYIKNSRTLLIVMILSFAYLAALDFGLLDRLFHLNHNEPSYILQLYYFSFQLPGQISYFIAGIFIYKHLQNKKNLSGSYRYIFALLIFASFIYLSSSYPLQSSFFINNLFILSVATTLFILLYNSKPKKMQWLEWIGKISYSLYLWHMPILFVMKKTSILSHLSILASVLLFTLSLLLISSLSYYLIEEGGFALRKKVEAKIKNSPTP